MSIEDIVDVQIAIQDAAIEQASFGRGLILGSSGKLTAKIESFADITAVEAVFAAGDPELIMAGKYFGQDIKAPIVYIGQRDADVKQKNKINIIQLVDDTDYTVTINATPYTIDSGPGATKASIVDDLIAAITGNEPVALTDNGDDFDIESTVAGDPVVITVSVNLRSDLLVANVNIATELAAISALPDGDKWYGLLSVSHLEVDIERAAAYIQSKTKIYGASSALADIIDPEKSVQVIDFDADFVAANLIDLDIDAIPVTQTPFDTDQPTTIGNLATNIQAHISVVTATVTGARQITITSEQFDVVPVIANLLVTLGVSQAIGSVTLLIDPLSDLGSRLKALSYDRTFLSYSAKADTEYPEAAWMGGRFPNDPGLETWYGKVLVGVTPDVLNSSQSSKALGNNVNIYTLIGGLGFTQDGKMASGRFIDVRRDVDSLIAGMSETIFATIAKSPKIPYTNAGIAVIESDMRSVVGTAVDDGILRGDPAPTFTIPKVSSIDVNDRANRLLPDMKFVAELAGAIHRVQVRGTVSV